MTATPSPDNLTIGRGEWFFDRFDANGNPTGEMSLGNSHAATIAFEDETIESRNDMDNAGGTYKKSIKSRKAIIKIQGEEWFPEMLAILQRGTVGTLSQTGATVTNEVLTENPKLGRWYPTLKRGISAVTVTQGLYPLTLTDDYLIDAVSGRIYLVPTGAATEYDPIEVDYTYASLSKTTIQAGTSSSITGSLRFKGDPVEGPAREIIVWKADLAGDGELGLITDEFGQWNLIATILSQKATHPTEPFYREIWL